jgi:hypothetical protein
VGWGGGGGGPRRMSQTPRLRVCIPS